MSISRIITGTLILVLMAAACRAQHYENLVMEGGGIRGIAYAGAIRALEEKNIAGQIKKVAGTSVGGLVAALFAVGYSANEMQDILSELQIRQFNDGNWFFIGGQLRFRKQYGWYRGDRLEQWIGSLIREKTGSEHTTFSELRTLAGKDSRYRDAFLCATDLSGQKATVFSADSFGDMELKTAIRASVSIPLYFTAVLLDAKGKRYPGQKSCPHCHVFIDGGMLANYPLHLFDSIAGRIRIPNPLTLGLKLERVAQLPENKGQGAIAEFPVSDLACYVSALYNLCIEELNRKTPFEDEQFRTIYISTSDITPRIRRVTAAQKQLLYRNGYNAANDFLKLAGFQ